MKRIITLFIVVFACISFTFAQTFAFFHNGTQLENNVEITVSEITVSLGTRIIESNLQFKNLTSSDLEATMTQTVLVTPTAGELTMCFQLCQESNEDLTQTTTVVSDYFDPLFHIGLYLPEMGTATAKVKYEIYPTDNVEDKYAVIVNYDPNRTGLNSQSANKNVMSVYQNGNNVAVDYNVNTSGDLQLYVYNTTGMVVAQHTLHSNQGSFMAPESLERGIYIAAIKQGTNVISLQKFMIR